MPRPESSQQIPRNVPMVTRNDQTIGHVQGRQPHISHIPDLIFETVHPNDPDHCFIFHQFTAEQHIASTLNYENAARLAFVNPIHQHEYYELIYVVRGEMYQIIENKHHLYPQGSLCLMNRNVRHQEEFSTDFYTAFLSIPAVVMEELVQNTFSLYFKCEREMLDRFQQMFFREDASMGDDHYKAYIDFIPAKGDKQVQETLHRLYQELVQEYTDPKIGSTYRIKYLLLRIFQHLLEPDNYTSIPLKLAADPELELLDDITALLRLHNGRLTRQQLADLMHYSGHYLNRVVKKHLGMTLQQYAMTFTMQYAGNILAMTRMTVEEICQLLRFTNQTHFYRAFQEYHHMTPKEYRRQHSSITADNKDKVRLK